MNEEYQTLLDIERAGNLNPVQRTRLNELRAQGNNGTFNFDYAGEAQKAYGELGTYYDQLLKNSKGDLDLALSRLVEDYDRGVRIKTEDTATGNAQDVQSNENNALRRGIYNKSLFDPFGSRGLGDVTNPDNPYAKSIAQRNLSLLRSNEDANITLKRQQLDLPEKERRYETDLEQQRRTEAGNLADTRGQRALQKYQLTLA